MEPRTSGPTSDRVAITRRLIGNRFVYSGRCATRPQRVSSPLSSEAGEQTTCTRDVLTTGTTRLTTAPSAGVLGVTRLEPRNMD
jgi:hypothetical protein